MYIYRQCHLITFRVSRRRREMYSGHARLSVTLYVCLSLAAFSHYCKYQDVTLANGRGAPYIAQYWVDLHLVNRFRCYENIARTRNVSDCSVFTVCLVISIDNDETRHRPSTSMYSLTFRVRRFRLYAVIPIRLPIRAALYCHSNETGSPNANPPNSAQLGGTRYHSPSYIRVRAVVWACGRGQTDRQTRVTTIHFASSTTHAKCD